MQKTSRRCYIFGGNFVLQVAYRVVKRVVDPAAYGALCKATDSDGLAFPAYLGWTA